MSLKTELNAGLAQLRRLEILKILTDAVDFALPEVVLQNSLAASAYPVSVADLRDDLRHLRERDCLHLDTGRGIWVAQLTRTGGEVAKGLDTVDGVARPAPGV